MKSRVSTGAGVGDWIEVIIGVILRCSLAPACWSFVLSTRNRGGWMNCLKVNEEPLGWRAGNVPVSQAAGVANRVVASIE
jgi:hypothetical protein